MSAPTQTQAELLGAHLRTVGMAKISPCPICQNKAWDFVGIFDAPVSPVSTHISLAPVLAQQFVTGSALQATVLVMPIARLVCQTCFYIRDFAWRLIGERG